MSARRRKSSLGLALDVLMLAAGCLVGLFVMLAPALAPHLCGHIELACQGSEDIRFQSAAFGLPALAVIAVILHIRGVRNTSRDIDCL